MIIATSPPRLKRFALICRRVGDIIFRHEEASATDLSPEAGPHARISTTHAHARRPGGAPPPSTEGPTAAHSRVNDLSIPRRERLCQTQRFLLIRREGRWARGQWLSVGVLPNDCAWNRLGIRFQQGVKSAVARNRAKRLLRQAYLNCSSYLIEGQDIVAVVLKMDRYELAAIETDLRRACGKLGLLRP